ncbi:MAG: carboxypeptidase regulatory-like domain-containing protein [Thermoplasmata archaeon]|nr:carboxypeptidase regulatory-like domain-containing protein [Thermoplasmata archaeon]
MPRPTVRRWRPASSRVARRGSIGLAIAVALVVTLPGGARVASPSVPGHSGTPPLIPRSDSHAPSGGASPFAGQVPSSRVVDAPAVFAASRSSVVRPPTNSSGAEVAKPTSGSLPPLPPGRSPSHAAASEGWFDGTVVDSLHGTGLDGATVDTSAGPGCIYCETVSTNATGFFRVAADAGPATVTFNDAEYVQNFTFATAVSGAVVSIGTIELVHFGTISGRVVADLPGLPDLANVTVTTDSRDFGESGPNVSLSAPNGSFRLDVDPLAIEVDFTPPNGTYLGNSTDAALLPWQVLNLGVVRLEGGVVVTVLAEDGRNGTVLGDASGEFCSNRIVGTCLPEAVSENNSVALYAVAGPGYVTIDAPGYVSNVTQVPDVPAGTAGPVFLGIVELLADGFVQVSVNFTGGTPNGTWSTGGADSFEIVTCSLSGMDSGTMPSGELLSSSCDATPATLGETVLAAAAPLRNVVFVYACYLVPSGFPVAEYQVFTPICPPHTPANVTWANVTSDRITDLGSFDVSAGDYLSGTIALTGSLATMPGLSVTVQACSTVRVDECQPGVASNASGPIGPVPAGCPSGAWAFCVPAPPGPDRVTIRLGAAENSTWVTVPNGCCFQQGHPIDLGTFGLDTDLGPTGIVHGSVAIAGQPQNVTPPGGWVGAVEICSAVASEIPCVNTSISSSAGTFLATVAGGWDVVTATVAGYRLNWTWVDVEGNNSSGTIDVTPYGEIVGQVVSLVTGDPIAESQVTVCNVASDLCPSLGLDDDSNGTFALAFPTLPYPAGTFQIGVVAAGYDPESTFANVTAGSSVPLPPIRMPPIGVDPGPLGRLAPRGANSSTPPTGAWVTARLLDAEDGLGVGLAQITVCQLLASSSCSFSSATASTGGEVNLSTVHGAYEIWFNSTYYASDEVYLNATTAGTIALGDVDLSELPRVTGRVEIDPWESLATSFQEGADQVVVVVCVAAHECGPEAAAGPGGYFNVSAPTTGSATIQFFGNGPAAEYGNGPGGYTSITLPLTVYATGTRVTGSGPGGSVPVPILGTVTGNLSESSGGRAAPADFAVYAILGNGTGGVAGFSSGGGGFYAAFVAAGANNTSAAASALGLVPGATFPSRATVAAGAVVTESNLTLARFGYVTANVSDAATGQPLGGIYLTATGTGGSSHVLVGSSVTNGSGVVNTIAPPGTVQLTVGSSLYPSWTGSTSVPSGGLVALGSVTLTALANGGLVLLRTPEVNTVAQPVLPGAFDNVSDRPVPDASVLETGPVGYHAGPIVTNDLGQFFLAGLPLANASLTVEAAGFNPLAIPRNLSAGGTSVFQPLNMTAGGIVTGDVVAEPGNVTVPYATVSVCPLRNPLCPSSVTTNATGVFWIAAPNATDQVSVVSNLYLANLTRIVNVPSDGFVELGTIPVFSFGTVHGLVRGLPSGDLLAGVNVSLCSQYSPPGGCLADESVTTDANGSFSLQSPPGVYFFDAEFPGYNASRFQILLGAGQNLNLGVVVIDEYGNVTGTVVASTGGVLENATVLSCATYGGGLCTSGPTNSDGEFRFGVPPGSNEVTVTAVGFLDAMVGATVVSGATLDLGTIVLTPAPPDVFENVTGTVTAAASGDPVIGAFVTATEAGARVGQSFTRADGTFGMMVAWGTATILAESPGFQAAGATVPVHADVSGVDFRLATMTYSLTGVVFDGGTGSVLPGATIRENGSTVATTDAAGAYTFPLPNGTARLVVTHAAVGAVVYGAVPFVVVVTGPLAPKDLTVPRSVVPLTGTVVDAATGAPIRSATVALWSPGGSAVSNASTPGTGTFAFAVGPGTYNVSVAAPGYSAANVTVATGPAGTYATVALEGVPAIGPAGGSSFPVLEVGLVGLAVAAVAVGALAWRRGRTPKRPEPATPESSAAPLGEDELT